MPTTDVVPVTGVALTRLLQLVSPALPIGAFAYSQGLEQAVASGWVTDEESAAELAAGPAARRPRDAGPAGARAAARRVAHRQPRAGRRVERVAGGVPPDARDARRGAPARRRAGPRARRDRRARRRGWEGCARRHAGGDVRARRRRASRFRRRAALAGYAFAWAEATTSAAVRLFPLGQSAGQRLLAAAGDEIPGRSTRARPRRRRAGGDGARPGDGQRAARGPLQPVVPIMSPTQTAAAPRRRRRPRRLGQDRAGRRAVQAAARSLSTSPSSPTTSTPRRTPSS